MATRKERVVLELDDQFTTPMARAAAASALLKRELDGLGKQSGQTSAGATRVSKDVDRISVSAVKADRSINQLTGRLRVLADVAAILGPTASPIGAVGAAGLAGLANQLGVAVLAGGSAVLAFQGVGDALKAMNDAAVEPTEAHVKKLNEQMHVLNPAARDMVQTLHDLTPTIKGLQIAGAEGLMPGAVEALEILQSRAPAVERIVHHLNEELGNLMAGGAASLAGEDWDDFFNFLATDARDTLGDLGVTVGNLTRGLTEMWMAFDPLNDDFSGWLRGQSEDFAAWADGLSATEGFAEFVEYVRESGPQVAATFSAIGGALLDIAEAAAPIGGPVLSGLESVAKVLGAIADSDLGTPIMAGVTALALYNRTLAVTKSLSSSVAGSTMLGSTRGVAGAKAAGAGLQAARADAAAIAGVWATAGARTEREQARVAAASRSLRTNLAGVARSAAPAGAALAGVGVLASGAADDIGLTNTASLALMGTMAGPWGAAIGGAAGLALDFANANDSLMDSLAAVNATLADAQVDPAARDLEVLTAQYEAAEQKVRDLADALNDPSMFSLSDIMAGAKNSIEGLFGRDDYEEAYEQYARATEGLENLRAAEMRAAADTAYYRKIQAETAALVDNIEKMREKQAALLAGRNAETGYASALLDANDALKDNGKTLDLTTREGIANRAALDNMAASWNQLNDTTKQTPAAHRAAIRSFVDIAKKMGMGAGEAHRLAREIMGIPESREVRIQAQYDDAFKKTLAIKRELASIDRNIDVYVNIRKPNAGGFGPQVGQADGSVLSFYANGGVENHVAQIAPAGAWRVWAEPETGGEAYIPLAPSKRDRSLAIWEETGRRLGVNAFAAGGTTAKGGTSKRSRLEAAIEKLTKVYERTERKAERRERQFEAAKAKRDGVAEAVSSNYRSSLFGQQQGAFLPSPGGPMGVLNADLGQLRALDKARKALSAKGLDGGALAELISQGRLGEVQAMAGWSKGQLAAYEKTFNQRERLLSSVGMSAGNAAYGSEIKERREQWKKAEQRANRLEKQLSRMEKALKDAPRKTGKATADGVNRGAQTGRRNRR